MAKINIEKITKNDFPKIILLCGEDSFSIDETLTKILSKIVVTENDNIDFEIADGENSTQNHIVNIASQLPMLSEKRVVVVKRFDKLFSTSGRKKKSDSSTPIEKYLEKPNSSTCLILTIHSQTKIDTAKFPYNIIAKNGEILEFPKVYENQLTNWVLKRFSELGKTISQNTAELIVAQNNPNLYSLANEVEKISLYNPALKEISYDLVLEIIGSTRENTVFELVNSVAQRDAKKAISIMLNILSTDSKEVLMITLLRDLFIKLWKLIELNNQGFDRKEIASQIGVSPFFLNDYLIGIKKYSPAEINQAFVILCETDQKIKSTNSNSKFIIEEMLVRIIM
jgi:DNA polymerase-3 subunit delta